MKKQNNPTEIGQLRLAPESFIEPELVKEISKHGVDENRRSMLRKSFGLALGAMAAPAVLAAEGEEEILKMRPWSGMLGNGVATNPYGQPSKYESNVIRRRSPGLAATSQADVAFSPLQSMFGMITASGLHFERHHQGWVDIDPRQHRLMINGLVKNAKVFTMDDLMRMPSVSRIHFIECGANTAMEWGNSAVPTVQYTHGMLSCSEFTGVPLSMLLEHAGYDAKNGKYIMAEGADGSGQNRTVDIDRAMDDCLVVYGQNGEMLRPEQGYPLRLLVPGCQGVSSIKYLRRIEVGDMRWSAKDESSGYADLMPDGMMRQYTSIQEAKSVITSPSGGQKLLSQGYYNISGLAWSGRGKIAKVDVSVDGGNTWKEARVDGPILPKALTRFNFDWVWDGKPALLQSRVTDETGYVQPQRDPLVAVRGTRGIYHNNAIQTWRVLESGEVENVQVS